MQFVLFFFFLFSEFLQHIPHSMIFLSYCKKLICEHGLLWADSHTNGPAIWCYKDVCTLCHDMMTWLLSICFLLFYETPRMFRQCCVKTTPRCNTLYGSKIFWEPFVLAEKLLEHLFSRFRKFEWKGLYIRLIKRKLYIFPAFGWWFISQKIKEISRCQSTGMMFYKYSKIKWLGHFPGLL